MSNEPGSASSRNKAYGWEKDPDGYDRWRGRWGDTWYLYKGRWWSPEESAGNPPWYEKYWAKPDQAQALRMSQLGISGGDSSRSCGVASGSGGDGSGKGVKWYDALQDRWVDLEPLCSPREREYDGDASTPPYPPPGARYNTESGLEPFLGRQFRDFTPLTKERLEKDRLQPVPERSPPADQPAHQPKERSAPVRVRNRPLVQAAPPPRPARAPPSPPAGAESPAAIAPAIADWPGPPPGLCPLEGLQASPADAQRSLLEDTQRPLLMSGEERELILDRGQAALDAMRAVAALAPAEE